MLLKERYQAVLKEFTYHGVKPVVLLKYRSDFDLLVAVVLSAQCTDKRVNSVTPGLFAAFPDVYSLAGAGVEEVLGYIGSVSYPRNKARYVVGIARRLVDDFQGRVPDDLASLLSLPGVGRKSAHVVLSVLYNRDVIAVDTHVFRVSKRLGLVSKRASTPLSVEKELMFHLPKGYRKYLNRWFISHGRHTCTAIKPRCDRCPFADWCLFFSKRKKLV